MWARIVEFMTAVWLGLSPFIFGFQDQVQLVWWDFGVAALICLFGGLSYWHPTRHAHLLTFVLAVALAIWGRLDGTPPSPAHQNHIAVGLFLLMIAYQGVRLGRSTHIVDMADQDKRAAYTALSNTVIGIFLLAGGVFGVLAQVAGEAAVLLAFCGLSLTAALVALRLEEVQATDA